MPNSDSDGDAILRMESGFEEGDDCGDVSKSILYLGKQDTRRPRKSRLVGNLEVLYDDSCTQVQYNMQRGKYLRIRNASSFYPAWRKIRRYGVRRKLRLRDVSNNYHMVWSPAWESQQSYSIHDTKDDR